jgi:prenyl protein peptidase
MGSGILLWIPIVVVGFEIMSLFQTCDHIQPSLLRAFVYCFGVAIAFVASLYLLVPAAIRQLDRDNPLQIKWRSFATATVCVMAILIYPWIFCTLFINDYDEVRNCESSVLARIGLYRRSGISLYHFWLGPLAHSMALYMGPITLLLLQVKLIVQESESTSPTSYLEAAKAVFFPIPIRAMSIPTEAQRQEEKWISWRSKVIAPVLEEIAFRGCLLPPLVATNLFPPWVVVWIAPLFFGLAHCHHAILMLRQGVPRNRVLQMTAFQFLYTTMFGAYASHAFLRTGSIVAVILSHSFCNTMGLPSLPFFDPRSTLYRYRGVLIKAYLLGVAIFVWGFFDTVFLPAAPQTATALPDLSLKYRHRPNNNTIYHNRLVSWEAILDGYL